MQKNILVINNELVQKAHGLTILNQSQSLSTESFESFVKGISQFFQGKLKIISGLFGTNQDRLKNTRDKTEMSLIVKELVNKKISMQKAIKTIQYSDIKDTLTPTVVGLNVDMLSAAKAIQNVFTVIHEDCIPALEDLDTYISKVLSDSDTRLTTTPARLDERLIKRTNELQKVLEDIISTRKVADATQFKELFRNMNTVEDTFNLIVNLSFSPTLDDMKHVDGIIQGIVQRINTLVDEMKDRDYEISKTVLNKVSNDVENGAKCVTVIMSHIHFYNQLVGILSLIIDRLVELGDK